MNRCGAIRPICLALLVTISVAGCKLVKNAPEGESGSSAAKVSGNRGGDMSALAAEIWDAKVVPHLRDNGVDLVTLGTAVTSNLDAAGKAYGYRPSSEGSPWNFATSVKGRIVAAKTDTRAATAGVDVNGDGKPMRSCSSGRLFVARPYVMYCRS